MQLGASYCNRPHDWLGPRDVYSGVEICVGSVPAVHALEVRLALAVRFLAVPTYGAGARGVSGVNYIEQDTGKSRLVGKERTQLSKSPGAMPRTLRPSNRASFPNVPKVF